MVLGVSAGFWLNLEKSYQEELLEIQKLSFMENCKDWVSRFPTAFLKKQGILPQTRIKAELSEALLKFFRIASPKEWKDIYCENSMAFKIELKHTSNVEAISVWLRIGELKTEQLNVKEFDKKEILNNIGLFEEICRNPSQNWMQDLVDLCAEQGIALVLVPSVPKAPIYGVARWLNKNSLPVIQLTDKNKDYNSFWFSFYHELGHILKHGKTDIFLEGLNDIVQDDKKEKEAHAFAKEHLELTQEVIDKFPRNFNLLGPAKKRSYIKNIAKENALNESIVVSQLRRMKLIDYADVSMKSLKIKVEV